MRATFRLDAQGLERRVTGRCILSDISLSVLPGEFVGLLGPSGAGKSTLLKALNGFCPADKGRVLLNGTNLYKQFARLRMHLGYVPQDDAVHMSLSVVKALSYAAELRFPMKGLPCTRAAIAGRVKEVIHLLGLDEQAKTKIKRLSGGQRKRVSLGMELLTHPPLLFLDEPTSGLDPGLEERMMQTFRRLADDGQTVIVTTHIMESLELLDLVALLVDGHLAFYGPPRLALKAFRVKEFSQIYHRLQRLSSEDIARQFAQSPLYQRYVTSRLTQRYATSAEGKAVSSQPAASPQVTSTAKEPQAPVSLSIDEELAALKRRLDP